MKHNTKSILSLILIPIMSLSLLFIPSDSFYKNHVVYAYSEQEQIEMYGDEYTKYGEYQQTLLTNKYNLATTIDISAESNIYPDNQTYHKQYQSPVIAPILMRDYGLYITNDAINPAPLLVIVNEQGEVNSDIPSGELFSTAGESSIVYSTVIEPGQTVYTGKLPLNTLGVILSRQCYTIYFQSDVPGDYLINISTEDPKIYE